MIGFSTGSLYKTNISFNERIKLYSQYCNAIELSFPNNDEFSRFDVSQLPQEIKKFGYISIHAPWQMEYKNNLQTKKLIDKLRKISENIPVHGIVIHPDKIKNFRILENSQLPFLMENMDKRKENFKTPEEFERLKRDYNFGFVLDIKHSYEYSPSTVKTLEFLEVMGDRLNEMHISGSSEEDTHILANNANNREYVSSALKLTPNIPKILEGILSKNPENEIKREVVYIKKA